MDTNWRAGSAGDTHISIAQVRAHPRFEDAKALLIDGLAGLYIDDARLRTLIEYEKGLRSC
ncbi:hypothetical protein ACFSLT_21300 [Novosphingobium resinovorum]